MPPFDSAAPFDGVLLQWLSQLLDDELSANESARLAELLRGDAQARDVYFGLIENESLLRQECGHAAFPGAWGAAEAAAPAELPEPAASRSLLQRRSVVSILFATASTVLILAVLAILRLPPRHDSNPAAVDSERPDLPALMRVVQVEGNALAEKIWDNAAVAFQPGDSLKAGDEIVLRGGRVQLQTRGNTEFVLQGPARYRVETAQTGYLQYGKLLAQVPARDRGFTVRTARASVIDLGTEFGVEVDEHGLWEVHVFEGSVDVVLGDPQQVEDPNAPRRVVGEGQALRLEPNDASAEILADKSRFPERQMLHTSASSYARAVVALPELVGYYRLGESSVQIARNLAEGDAALPDGRYLGGPAVASYGPRPPQFPGFDSTNRALQPSAAGRGAGPIVAIENIAPYERWSLAAWVMPANLSANPQTFDARAFLSRDLPGWNDDVIFGITPEGSLASNDDDFKPRRNHWEIIHQDDATETRLVAESPEPAQANRWCFLVCTYDGSALRLYIDGELAASASDDRQRALRGGEAELIIGARLINGMARFQGKVDEVAVFSRAVSAEEIKRLWEAAVNGEAETRDAADDGRD